MDIHELSFYYIYILFFIYYVRNWGVCVLSLIPSVFIKFGLKLSSLTTLDQIEALTLFLTGRGKWEEEYELRNADLCR